MDRNLFLGPGQSKEPTPEQINRTADELIRAMHKEVCGDRRCPKCDGQMYHTRLAGYRCVRGCQ